MKRPNVPINKTCGVSVQPLDTTGTIALVQRTISRNCFISNEFIVNSPWTYTVCSGMRLFFKTLPSWSLFSCGPVHSLRSCELILFRSACMTIYLPINERKLVVQRIIHIHIVLVSEDHDAMPHTSCKIQNGTFVDASFATGSI